MDLQKVTFETLGKMLSSTAVLQVEDVSHHILLVSPQSNHNHHSITIPSHYIYTKLCDQLHIHTLEEAAKLYQIFEHNKYTKGSAGHIFEDVHNLFCHSGEWQIMLMTKNKAGCLNTHFRPPILGEKSSFMHLGYEGAQLVIKHHSLPADVDAKFTWLAHHRYLLGKNIHLQDGYYQPTHGQPTFNSFIYDTGTKTATMLQMMVATCHDAKVWSGWWVGVWRRFVWWLLHHQMCHWILWFQTTWLFRSWRFLNLSLSQWKADFLVTYYDIVVFAQILIPLWFDKYTIAMVSMCMSPPSCCWSAVLINSVYGSPLSLPLGMPLLMYISVPKINMNKQICGHQFRGSLLSRQ